MIPIPVSPRTLLIGAVAAAVVGLGVWLYAKGRGDANVAHERAAVRQDTENREVRSEVDRRMLADPARAPELRERWTRD